MQVVDSVPAEAIEHPKAPEQEPKESLASEAITRKCLIDYMLNEAKWEILNVKWRHTGWQGCHRGED